MLDPSLSAPAHEEEPPMYARNFIAAAIVLALAGLSSTALAQPTQVPIQGYLTDDVGQTVDGEVPVRFSLYSVPTGGSAWFSELHEPLTLEDGHFIANLGSVGVLDLAEFEDGPMVYLEVEVDGETLTPRVALLTVPYAAWARRAGGVPWTGITGIPGGIADGDDDTTYTAGAPLILNVGTGQFGLSSVGCDAGDAWVWTGATWQCSAAASDDLDGGLGIDVTGTTISIDAVVCGANQYSAWTAAGWICRSDNAGLTSISPGSGIGVVGNQVSVAADTCPAGQYLTWTGSDFDCVADASVVSPGDGIQIDAGDVAIDAPTCGANQYSFWDGDSWGCADDREGITSIETDAGISLGPDGLRIVANTCGATEYSYWDGDSWECRTDRTGLTSVTGGSGISVSGSTISIQASACSGARFSRWTGSSWACETDRQGVTSVTQGNGITVSGSATSRTVSIRARTCTAGQYSYWDGNSWECRNDVGGIGAVNAGNGISVSSSGSTRTVSTLARTCSGSQYSYWDGNSWECRSDLQGVTRVQNYDSSISVFDQYSTARIRVNSNVMPPIGSIIAWHQNLPGTPGIPAGWQRCDGSRITASQSPMRNQFTPNLNGFTTSASGDGGQRGRFLRGSTTSGFFQTDQANNFHQAFVHDDDDGCGDNCTGTLDDDGNWSRWMGYYRSNDAVRYRLEGIETRPTNMSVVWIMRIY